MAERWVRRGGRRLAGVHGAIALLAALACCTGAESPRADGLRVATFNTKGLGRPNGPACNALADVLNRADADVVLLQEIRAEHDVDRLAELASATSYPHMALSDTSGTLSGDLHTACLSRRPIRKSASFSAAELAADPGANDITRDIFAVWIAAAAAAADEDAAASDAVDWIFVTVHLKAGHRQRDRFRRQLETKRLLQAIARVREQSRDARIVLAGDFNQHAGARSSEAEHFERAPSGLPPSYRLGADIVFPLHYEPLAALERAGLRLLDAFHEDDPKDAITHRWTRRRIDLIWIGAGIEGRGAEVYDSCDDNGFDDPPPGHWLPKAGDPLACGISAKASDHLLVFADIDVRL